MVLVSQRKEYRRCHSVMQCGGKPPALRGEVEWKHSKIRKGGTDMRNFAYIVL